MGEPFAGHHPEAIELAEALLGYPVRGTGLRKLTLTIEVGKPVEIEVESYAMKDGARTAATVIDRLHLVTQQPMAEVTSIGDRNKTWASGDGQVDVTLQG